MNTYELDLTLDTGHGTYRALVVMRGDDAEDAEELACSAVLDGRLRPAWACRGLPANPGLDFTAEQLSVEVRAHLAA